MKKNEPNSTGPLSAATLYVLLALSSQDLHGYGIIQEVTRLSEGKYRLGPGTLYDNLKKLMNCGWAEDYQDDQLSADERRRMYRLTAAGRTALHSDLSRMKRILRIAGGRLVDKGSEA
jgi:PadR family transcriptional regulator, regulatory protein PadR